MIEVVFTWNIYWWVVLVLASGFISSFLPEYGTLLAFTDFNFLSRKFKSEICTNRNEFLGF